MIGCGVVHRSPCLRAQYASMLTIGPGRYSALAAIRSSIRLGFILASTSFIPPDSNWNTPLVSPCEKIW